jgi:hypothetical protein
MFGNLERDFPTDHMGVCMGVCMGKGGRGVGQVTHTRAQEEGEYDKSILLHQQTLALKKKTLGDEHLSISTTLGTTFSKREQPGESETRARGTL